MAAVITFLLCLAIVLGSYWAFIVRPEDNAARKLRKRLRAEAPEVSASVSGGRGLTRRHQPLSALKGLDTLLGRTGNLLNPLRQTLQNSGLSLTLGVIVLA